ncbi:MAG TPA: glycerate kinase [Acidimicrobiales bacterium]|jgi:glycerate kinase|nr:glycerate kinase [Acidimicrobiales bacterium]
MPLLVAAPDKFRGTATAGEVAGAIERAASSRGWTVRPVPVSDGGEGLLETYDEPGSRLRTTTVTGPLGDPVEALWRVDGNRAVVEMSRASGLVLAGGAERNDPVNATTRGTGELMVAAAAAVGRQGTVVVGLGGSATTDGGWGAIGAVEEAGGLGGVSLIGACDVQTTFIEAAAVFAPQKGATSRQVLELEDRLRTVADRYQADYGVDVRGLPGAGAAGGLGGALVALGGRLQSGYELVADLVGLRRRLDGAQVVVTGEGSLDRTSFAGKVVGGIVRDASTLGVPVLVIAGRVADGVETEVDDRRVHVVSLVREFGERRAVEETVACIETAVAESLDRFAPGEIGFR